MGKCLIQVMDFVFVSPAQCRAAPGTNLPVDVSTMSSLGKSIHSCIGMRATQPMHALRADMQNAALHCQVAM